MNKERNGMKTIEIDGAQYEVKTAYDKEHKKPALLLFPIQAKDWPQEGDEYWDGGPADVESMTSGNFFKSEAEAQAVAECFKEVLKYVNSPSTPTTHLTYLLGKARKLIQEGKG